MEVRASSRKVGLSCGVVSSEDMVVSEDDLIKLLERKGTWTLGGFERTKSESRSGRVRMSMQLYTQAPGWFDGSYIAIRSRGAAECGPWMGEALEY